MVLCHLEISFYALWLTFVLLVLTFVLFVVKKIIHKINTDSL